MTKYLTPRKQKSEVTTEKRRQNVRLRNDCGPTSRTVSSNWCGLSGLRDPQLPTNRQRNVIKKTHIEKIENNHLYKDQASTVSRSGEIIKINTDTSKVIRIVYKNYQMTSAKVSYAPPKLKVSSGQRSEGVPIRMDEDQALIINAW